MKKEIPRTESIRLVRGIYGICRRRMSAFGLLLKFH